jgi:curved DNA-binding protein CbpA
MTGEPDPYEVLQIAHDASEAAVRAAYRAAARLVHPDVSTDPHAAARMARLNKAWELLGDTARRARYDREHGFAVEPQPAAWPVDQAQPAIRRTTADGRIVEWRTGPDGTGAAGPPPGSPSGSILPFGRFIAWSLGEIARHDAGYLDWLDQRREGAPYRAEINELLTKLGWRTAPPGGRSAWWNR